MWKFPILALSLALGLAALPLELSGQRGALDGQWTTYGGDPGSTKFSAVSQIDEGNVARVDPVWVWESPDDALAAADPRLTTGAFKATPLMVDGVLYIRTSLSQVAAIDAVSGEQLWVFDPRSYEAGRPTNLGFNSRGVAYWSDGAEDRIFLATGDARLWALDPGDGRPVQDFGEGGSIDLAKGLPHLAPANAYSVMSPPLVVADVVVVGSSISDAPDHMSAPPGDVRAFDVRTGAERWTFHTVPRAGEVGNDTWLDDSWQYTGNTNVWSIMSADPELGYVYLPVGTPTNDWYGGHRPGAGLFGESLVAVEAATGRRVWHFQLVHHGLWDYDLPAAPTLVDIEVAGRPIRAVAQVTKQGFVYVFDRVTGEPVWPIEERPVPQSTVPGERTSPTQPFPTRPAPFDRQGIGVEDLIDFSPELRAEAEAILEGVDHGPLFQPPSERGTLQLPGWYGGADWQGAAVNPSTHVLFVPSRTSPIFVRLVPGDPARSDFRYVRGSGGSAAGPRGLPLVKPPYARLTAIDLDTGEHLWQVPLGDGIRQELIDMGLSDPGPLGGGSFTGALLTETLLFIGHSGARDGTAGGPALLAMDPTTGRVVRAIELPADATGTPMTYLANGRQFIVVAFTERGRTGLVALAAPE